jgi:hypothetical protein
MGGVFVDLTGSFAGRRVDPTAASSRCNFAFQHGPIATDHLMHLAVLR